MFTLNLWNITSKFRTFGKLEIVASIFNFHTQFVDIFILHFCTKFEMHNSNCSLVININSKAKENHFAGCMSFLYIIHDVFKNLYIFQRLFTMHQKFMALNKMALLSLPLHKFAHSNSIITDYRKLKFIVLG
jgi:hypothetical protein